MVYHSLLFLIICFFRDVIAQATSEYEHLPRVSPNEQAINNWLGHVDMPLTPVISQKRWLRRIRQTLEDELRQGSSSLPSYSRQQLAMLKNSDAQAICNRHFRQGVILLADIDSVCRQIRQDQLQAAWRKSLEGETHLPASSEERARLASRLKAPGRIFPSSSTYQQTYNAKVQEMLHIVGLINVLVDCFTEKWRREAEIVEKQSIDHGQASDTARAQLRFTADVKLYSACLLNEASLCPHQHEYQERFGADFLGQLRSPWGPSPLLEHRYD